MKKLITLALALVMCAAMSLTAFAVSENGLGLGDKTINVNAKYAGGLTTPDVYSVNISWGEMEFTYYDVGTRLWNNDTHTYERNATASWTVEGNTITVTNHSNKAVNAEFTFEKATGITDDIIGSFDFDKTVVGNTVGLLAGVEGRPNDADSVTATLKLSGTLGSDKTALTKVGTITVTLG